MKQSLLILFVLLSAQLFAQDFIGYVKRTDSLSTPIYQAKIDVTEGDKPFTSLRSYFNGMYKFTPAKGKTYTVKITYSGYTDTAFTVTTDKNGKPQPETVTVRLKKDGMRLMGVIRSREEDFPIKSATIVLKNVMTREEKRFTTDIDGAYNFKLEYETNYRVSIDKRSAGIINTYKDTTFYVSTIGFNQPLDYKLDIYLDPVLYATTTVREGYDPTSPKGNLDVKPVVEVGKKEAPISNNQSVKDPNPFVQEQQQKSAEDKIAQLQAELEKTRKELEDAKKREQQKKFSGGGAGVSAPKKKNNKDEKEVPVVVIDDKPVAKEQAIKDDAQIVKEAEQKAVQIEGQIAKEKVEAQRKADELAALQKAITDSVAKAREEQEMVKMTAALQKQSQEADSANQAREKQQKELAVRMNAKRDSLAKASAEAKKKQAADSLEKVKIQKEFAVKEKARNDSIAKAAVATRQKMVADSIAQVKALKEQQAKEKARIDSIAKVYAAVAKKAQQDSIANAMAAHQKYMTDSLAQVKIKNEEAAKAKATADSLAKAHQAAQKKAQQDSLTRVAEAAKKHLADSLAKVQALKESMAREAALEKAYNDSIAKVKAANQPKQSRCYFTVTDTGGKFIVGATAIVKNSKGVEVSKKITDSKGFCVVDVMSLTRYSVQVNKADYYSAFDSIYFTNKDGYSCSRLFKLKPQDKSVLAQDGGLSAVKKNNAEELLIKALYDSIARAENLERRTFFEDSLIRIKKEQTRRIREAAEKRAYEDSLVRAKEVARQKFLEDSFNREQAKRDALERERLAKKIKEDSIEKARATAWMKAYQDSIARLSAEQERVEKEKLAKKAYEDSVTKAQLLARDKFVKDSIAAEQKRLEEEALRKKQEEERLQQEALTRQKFVMDSIATVQAELARKAAEQEAIRKKAEQDSIANAKTMAQKAAEEEAKRKAAEAEAMRQAEEKRKMDELVAKNARNDSLARLKIEQERIAAELKATKARNDSIAKVEAKFREMARKDSLAAAKEELKRKEKEAAEKEQLAEAEAKRKLDERKRFVQDSLSKAKAQAKLDEEKRQRDEAAQRDRIEQEKKLAEEKRKLQELAAAKAREDSLAKAKAEGVKRKQFEDSVNKALAMAHERFVKDSINLAKTNEARRKQEEEDRRKLEAIAASNRQKQIQDSLAQAKAMEEKRAVEEKVAKEQAEVKRIKDELEAARKKAVADSVTRVENEQKEKQLAAQKIIEEEQKQQQLALEQKRIEEEQRIKQDSVAKAVAEQQRLAAEQEQKHQQELATAAAAKKRMQDSLAQVQLEKERMAKELAALQNPAEATKNVANSTGQSAPTNSVTPEAKTPMADINVTIVDAATDAAIAKSYVSVKNSAGVDFGKLQTDDAGAVKVSVPVGGTYYFVASKNRYNPVVDTLIISTNSAIPLSKTYKLPKTPVSPEIISAALPVVEFEKNGYELNAKARMQLKDVIQALNDAPLAKVKISAIASSDEGNPKIVSLRRSDAVLKFLIQNGIAVERVICSYYGNSVSRNGCTSPNCPEELLQQNRCAAFELVNN